ncbi:MAG: hypothetical protein CMP74_00955 [Flavobacteriales bacterium]|nr:hypothetical protein [Flavobacteriales bacterium]|tara:strand:- start:744 stop:2090 length:1347 start_codon:yes stop_codon:yes gene_type:complete
MKKVLVIILLFVFQISFSQSGNVIIKGNLKSASGKMYLYEILGSESFLIDSTFVSNKTFQFKSRNFVKGYYKLSLSNESNSVEIVVNPDESSVLNINFTEYRLATNYTVLNSRENEVKKLYNLKKAEIDKKINSNKRNTNLSVAIRKQNNANYQQELLDYSNELVKKYPSTYTGKVLSHSVSPNQDVSYKFFDDIDFSDESIIRSNMMTNRIQQYMILHSNYDAKNNPYAFYDVVDYIMSKAKVNDRVAEFCMYNMLDGFYNTAATSTDPMWSDLCNYIIDEYFFGDACGEVEISDLMKERATKFKDLQIGSVPPDFSIRDQNDKIINLNTVAKQNDYTIIMFWASHCSHCMVELPQFLTWYNSNKNKGVEVIAISLDSNKSKWTQTINDYNFSWLNVSQFLVYKSPVCKDYKVKKTPTIFVLDSSMKIVSKPKDTNSLKIFLNNKLN